MNHLERSVENKKIVWFAESNRYMLVEIPAYHVISKLGKGEATEEIVDWCSTSYDLPRKEAGRFVSEIELFVTKYSVVEEYTTEATTQMHSVPYTPLFSIQKYYKINDRIFSVAYENQQTVSLIHPKFSHHEIFTNNDLCDHFFQVFQNQGKYVLQVNGEIIGQWPAEDTHYFTGKFSMELVSRMYGKTEPDWMAVFHASAIRKENRCVMFLGGSGSGKSTITALLMANGYHLLADDFVPVDAATGEVFFFPASVSVKKTAIDHLIPFYPGLVSASEYYFPELDKTVRYIPPLIQAEKQTSGCQCQALIFVKYQENSDLVLTELTKDIAFQLLVPDSWISPITQNASLFLDWFLKRPCYQLTYSDNDKMLIAIEKIFCDELQGDLAVCR